MRPGQGGAQSGALQRSLRAITIGAVQASNEARDRRAASGLQEIDHQFQVPIAGQATRGKIVAGVVDVEFEAPMVDGYNERQAPFSDPTFTSGFVLTSAEPVILTAAVQRWTIRDDIFYTGARVRICVFAPLEYQEGTSILLPHPTFRGEVHMNFTGFGPPRADEPEGDVQG